MAKLMELLQRAMQLQGARRFAEAETILRHILEVDPRQSDALHILGLVKSQTGDFDESKRLLRAALNEAPQNASIWTNLGIVLRQSNQVAEAIQVYQKALELEPTSETYFALGRAYKLQGELALSEQALQNSIRLNENNPSPWVSMIGLKTQLAEYDQALAWAEEAQRRFPTHVEVLTNLGVALKHSRKMEESLVAYAKAVEYAPNHVDLICRLASGSFTLHRFEEGLAYLRRAEAIAPKAMEVLNAWGLYYNSQSEWEAAQKVFRESITRYAVNPVAYLNLSNLLRRGGDFSGALECAQHETKADPNDPESMQIESGALVSLGRLDEALALLDRVIEQQKGHIEAHQGRLMCLQYRPQTTEEELWQAHREWNDRYAQPIAETDKNPSRISASESFQEQQVEARMGHRKLRIGFTSGDLGLHPVGYFTLRLFESIERSHFETFVYSDKKVGDWLNTRISQTVTQWRTTAALSDLKLWEQIRSDKVDILFDLSGHTDKNRLMVFARRAAPVQITWAGYVGTTGLQQMDYILADALHIPRDSERWITEQVLRMPHDYITYFAPPSAPPLQPLPALKKGFVTFGSMCNPCKVNPDVLNAWATILRSVEGSRLVLSYIGWCDRGNRARVENAMEALGCGGRVDFETRTTTEAVMELYNQIDLALDTFPYSGGLTTCEALWMGVPTVTFPGNRFASRHSTSHMTNVGLPQFVASDLHGYIAKAVNFAHDLAELDRIRSQLRDQMLSSPLCDGPRFARDFEAIMRQAFEAT